MEVVVETAEVEVVESEMDVVANEVVESDDEVEFCVVVTGTVVVIEVVATIVVLVVAILVVAILVVDDDVVEGGMYDAEKSLEVFAVSVPLTDAGLNV